MRIAAESPARESSTCAARSRAFGARDPAPEYSPRRPADTLLYQTVRDELEPFLARAREREQPPPHFVEQELRAYLRCGVLAHGYVVTH